MVLQHVRYYHRYPRVCKMLLFPLQCMGMNAILVFFWHGTAESLLNVVYAAKPVVGGGTASPKGELLGVNGWIHETILGGMIHGEKRGKRREGKGREGKGREGKREEPILQLYVHIYDERREGWYR